MTTTKLINFTLSEKELWQIYFALNFRSKVLEKEGQLPLSQAHTALAKKIKSLLI